MSTATARHLPPAKFDEPTYTCWKCRDAPDGWILLRCPQTPCERTHTHPAHWFAVRCTHWLKTHEGKIREAAAPRIEKHQQTSREYDAVCALSEGRYRYGQAVTW